MRIKTLPQKWPYIFETIALIGVHVYISIFLGLLAACIGVGVGYQSTCYALKLDYDGLCLTLAGAATTAETQFHSKRAKARITSSGMRLFLQGGNKLLSSLSDLR